MVWLMLTLACMKGVISPPPEARHVRDLQLVPSRIAFGSCNRHDRAQDLWPAVRSLSPDAWVWLGDAIYADGKVDNVRRYGGRAFHRDAYATQNEHPEYAALRAETRILGTWDDHDYGFNNAGAEWREKEFAQRLFLDFLGEPRGSPRRTRAGVYEAYTFRGLGASGTGSSMMPSRNSGIMYSCCTSALR